MRKSKDVKRKRREAAKEFRKGNRPEAYKMWREAKKELDTLRGRNQPAAAAAPAPAPAEG